MRRPVLLDHPRESTASLYLRLGLIFVFAYVPVASYLDPAAYYHYLPAWSATLIDRNLALNLLSVFESGLVVWFIWGRFLFLPSILSASALLGIVVFNMGSFSVVFRNIAIILASLALASLSRARES